MRDFELFTAMEGHEKKESDNEKEFQSSHNYKFRSTVQERQNCAI
jgi:hypothetical protein